MSLNHRSICFMKIISYCISLFDTSDVPTGKRIENNEEKNDGNYLNCVNEIGVENVCNLSFISIFIAPDACSY